jgi:hypothetical protein
MESNKELNPKEKAELLRVINSEITTCAEKLKDLKQQRLELTCNDPIEFTVSTIHKDRLALILNQIMKVDQDRMFDDLKEEWRASVSATRNGWFGEVKASGSKAKLISVLRKIAKHGGTVIVDPVHMFDIPAANKWWDYELEAQLDAERETVKSNEKEEQQ